MKIILKNIDSDDKAYWLGWLFSDGCLNEKRNSIFLGLAKKDREIIENFRKYLKSNKPIQEYKGKDNREIGFGISKGLFIFSFDNKKIATDLKRVGMKQKKSLTLEFPKIKERLFFPFMRGFIEGDGWIFMNKCNKFCVGFLGTKEFTISALNIFKKYGFTFNVRRTHENGDKNVNMFTSVTCAKQDCLNLLDLLYKDCGDLFLTRKRNNYLKMKEYFKLNPHKTVHIKRRPKTVNFN